jgi:hypothetical protein
MCNENEGRKQERRERDGPSRHGLAHEWSEL